MTQADHDEWNARHFPGTRQICEACGEPTGRCEYDSLYDGDCGPLCRACRDATEDEAPRQYEVSP